MSTQPWPIKLCLTKIFISVIILFGKVSMFSEGRKHLLTRGTDVGHLCLPRIQFRGLSLKGWCVMALMALMILVDSMWTPSAKVEPKSRRDLTCKNNNTCFRNVFSPFISVKPSIPLCVVTYTPLAVKISTISHWFGSHID